MPLIKLGQLIKFLEESFDAGYGAGRDGLDKEKAFREWVDRELISSLPHGVAVNEIPTDKLSVAERMQHEENLRARAAGRPAKAIGAERDGRAEAKVNKSGQ